jgi:4-hydroxythreonine-4-phosphate dehydrogenase
VTLGDPGGIGPEVVVKALADPAVRALARWRVLGPRGPLERAAALAGTRPYWGVEGEAGEAGEAGAGVVVVDYPLDGAGAHRPTAEGGEVSFRLVEDAIALAKLPVGGARRVDGVVTGPISKGAWALAGHGEFPGHTELFAARLGAARHAMMFQSPGLRVVLVTAHLPLMRVGAGLTGARVLDTIELAAAALARLGIPRGRIAVCGLNPHAGEGGMLGDEDGRVIAPAIRAAQGAGIDARGPFPADTVFNAAVRGDFDLVVAMYHDQGLIPVKLLAWDSAVNVTIGLPTVRTSPDHGTAFDIAGQNRADPGSMKAALALAARMAAAPG